MARKEFHGAGGLLVTDAMAVAVAAQACLLLVGLASDKDPAAALAWYDDFVGIVLHPGEVLARREIADEAGVVHAWSEALTGEAMEGGPVMLSWADVADAGTSAAAGYNVVMHEFAHKIDMADGYADGVPRRLSSTGGRVLVGGEHRPIAGTITSTAASGDSGVKRTSATPR